VPAPAEHPQDVSALTPVFTASVDAP
jgi:hypothetical protein